MASSVKVKLPIGSPTGTLTLCKKAVAKNTALGGSSPVTGFVDMTDFNTKYGNAKTLQEDGDTQSHLAESLYSQLVKKMGLAKGQTRKTESTGLWYVVKVRDVLLLKYRGSEDQMEEFGFSVVVSQTGARRNVRVVIPRNNPEELIELSKDIIAQDTLLGVASPLVGLVDMAAFGTLITAADTMLGDWETATEQAQSFHNQAMEVFGYAPDQTSDTVGTLYYDIVAIRDRLLDVYEGAEEQMSEWGFDVVITRRKSPGKRSGTLKEGPVAPESISNINVAGLTITGATGLRFENPGAADLTYYFSASPAGVPAGPSVAVATGQTLIRTAGEIGYSGSAIYLTVRNETGAAGLYKVTVGG